MNGCRKFEAAKPGHGVDVNNPSKLVDMKAAGIVDPARVTKEAVQNAVSIAGTAMTMGALVVDVPEKKLSARRPWWHARRHGHDVIQEIPCAKKAVKFGRFFVCLTPTRCIMAFVR